MDILVVGGGGREHAIIRKLKESPRCGRLYCAPGNGGIAKDAECCDVAATDIPGMVALAKRLEVDLVFVAPDDPLVAGMADAMEKAGIAAFGPFANAAILEGSKVFSKKLMKKYGIPTAGYEVFDKPEEALEYIRRQDRYPAVIKADGLALGKGVVLCADYQEACKAVKEIMEDRVFGESGSRVVVEEFLTGPEVSVLAFTDGLTVKPMVSAKDHKRAFDGDLGPNTGGMGTISPNPYYTPEYAAYCMEHIFQPTVDAMRKEGRPFKGCLFFGLMLTPDGPKVIEYNCRFGDPETQVVLPLLESDLLDIMLKIYDEKLSEADVRFAESSACCVVMASEGYPKKYETGFEITMPQDKNIYVAGAKLTDGKLLTSGGRVLGVTETAPTLAEAVEKAYQTVAAVHFENAYYRNDIGARALAAGRN